MCIWNLVIEIHRLHSKHIPISSSQNWSASSRLICCVVQINFCFNDIITTHIEQQWNTLSLLHVLMCRLKYALPALYNINNTTNSIKDCLLWQWQVALCSQPVSWRLSSVYQSNAHPWLPSRIPATWRGELPYSYWWWVSLVRLMGDMVMMWLSRACRAACQHLSHC